MNQKKLLESIKESMTCNWDVLCSYDEEKINKVLAKKFEAGENKLVSEIKYSKKYEDKFRKTTNLYELMLTLKAPKIHFLTGERNICQVDMPIEKGRFTLSEKRKGEEEFEELGTEEIKENEIILRCDVPLSATAGDGIRNEEGKISFVQENKTSKIYLHFKHSDLTVFKLIPYSEEVEENSILFSPDMCSDIMEGVIYAFLESVDEVQYELGAVSNSTEYGNELVPKSFIFAAYKAADSAKGCLNIYIQTQNSGFGQGDSSPAFLVSGSSVSPYPDDPSEDKKYSAALYIKKEVLLDRMISPGLPKNITAAFGNDEEKRLEIWYYLDKEVTIPKIKSIPGVSLLKSEDTVFNINEAPIKLLFDGEAIHVSWTYTFKCRFKGKIGFGVSSMHISETATVVAVYDDIVDISKESAESLKIAFNMSEKSKYKFDITTKTGGFPGVFASLDDESDLERHLKKQLPFSVEDMKLDISSISVFTVANILMPGTHIFQFSHKDGVYRPNDIVMYGNVVDV